MIEMKGNKELLFLAIILLVRKTEKTELTLTSYKFHSKNGLYTMKTRSFTLIGEV